LDTDHSFATYCPVEERSDRREILGGLFFS